MARDYAAEYAARQARARAEGYGGYWQQRTARALGLEQDRPGGLPPAHVRQMSAADMRAGVNAMKRKDWTEADRLARQQGFGQRTRRPRGMSDKEWDQHRAPRRAFWYH